MTIHKDYYGNDPRGVSEHTQREMDAADDDLDQIVSVYKDAKIMIEHLERLRANGTLQIPALQPFLEILDDSMTDLLAGDWQRLIEKGSLTHIRMPRLIEKPTVPVTPRTYSETKE